METKPHVPYLTRQNTQAHFLQILLSCQQQKTVLLGFSPPYGKGQSSSSFQYHISHFLLRSQKEHGNVHIPTKSPQENSGCLLWHLGVPPSL